MAPIDKEKYLRLFQKEAEPHFQQVVEVSNQLSRSDGDRDELLEKLAKSYHYFKGALGLIGQKELREIAVETEKIVKLVIEENRTPTGEELTIFIDKSNEIRDTVNRLLGS